MSTESSNSIGDGRPTLGTFTCKEIIGSESILVIVEEREPGHEEKDKHQSIHKKTRRSQRRKRQKEARRKRERAVVTSSESLPDTPCRSFVRNNRRIRRNTALVAPKEDIKSSKQEASLQRDPDSAYSEGEYEESIRKVERWLLATGTAQGTSTEDITEEVSLQELNALVTGYDKTSGNKFYSKKMKGVAGVRPTRVLPLVAESKEGFQKNGTPGVRVCARGRGRMTFAESHDFYLNELIPWPTPGCGRSRLTRLERANCITYRECQSIISAMKVVVRSPEPKTDTVQLLYQNLQFENESGD